MSVFGEIFYKCHKHSLYIYGFDDVERVRYVFRLYVTMVSIFNDELSKYFSGSFRTIVEFFLNFTYLQLKLMIFHFWKYFLSKYFFFHLSFLVDNNMYLIRSWTHTRIRKNQKINLSEVPLSGTIYSYTLTTPENGSGILFYAHQTRTIHWIIRLKNLFEIFGFFLKAP